MLHPIHINTSDNHEDVADWMETTAFLRQSVSFNELRTLSTDNEDSPQEDLATEETEGDEFVNNVADILDIRHKTLKELYPFVIEDGCLCIREGLTDTHYVYLFCLVISHLSKDSFLADDAQLLSNEIRTLFQVAATAAAAAFWPDGKAFCFGWPRTDIPSFLKALRVVYKKIGSGTVVEKLPGFARSAKDGGIDVIAWAHYGHSHGLSEYLLGQVATGADWNDKNVNPGTFHHSFFSYPPRIAERCGTATFVPHIVGKEIDEDEKAHWFQVIESKHGKLICRNRLVNFAEKVFARIAAGEAPENIMNRYEDFERIRTWIEGLRVPDHTPQDPAQQSGEAQ